jgi:hypothetical protein
MPIVPLEGRILFIRGHKIMLDSDLAEIYRVSVKRLNEQVKRNNDRFPKDFMFQLTLQEASEMRSQFATASKRNIRYQPFVFTEYGAVMLASVLNSTVAIEASIEVVRAFIKMRSILGAHKELSRKLNLLEKQTDIRFKAVFDAIRSLMQSPNKRSRPIGFVTTSK